MQINNNDFIQQKIVDIIYRNGLLRKDIFKNKTGFLNFQRIKKGRLLANQNGNELCGK